MMMMMMMVMIRGPPLTAVTCQTHKVYKAWRVTAIKKCLTRCCSGPVPILAVLQDI